MSLHAPPPLTHNPLRRIAEDLRFERGVRAQLPSGQTDFSLPRTWQFMDDPLSVLLPCYERYGPVFSLRVFHELVVFLIGPEANHFVLVSGAEHFAWRQGDYSQLVPLIGNGLLTTDGPYHDRVRRLLLPTFHHTSVARAAETMLEEAERAVAQLPAGQTLDLYAWARRLAMRIAMRALLGLDPDDRDHGARAAELFGRALAYYATGPLRRSARGPGTAWRRMLGARAGLQEILAGEIARRRAGRAGPGEDVLGMLMDARDQTGRGLNDVELRDQLMTLAFAAHDTSTSTIAFLIHELARHPLELDSLRAEQDAVLGGREPGPRRRHGALPRLEMAIEETLRLYPPAWIGPRRVVRPFEFGGRLVPAGVYAAYSSWATHHLPELFEAPEEFRPARFDPAARAMWPRGAYVPFGGGSRTCIGMRFGQAQVRAVACALLGRFRPQVPTDYVLRVRQMPTLGPARGLPVTMHAG